MIRNFISSPTRRTLLRSAAVVLLATWVLPGDGGFRAARTDAADVSAKNLILITVDTLRPDRLGSGGHRRDTSPALDRLAAEGVRFSRAYSQAGWTLPSVASILTGRYPRDHGAETSEHSLRGEIPTLASLLAGAGYSTAAHVSHVLLTPKYGLDRGFESFSHSVLRSGDPHKTATAGPLTDQAIATLSRLEPPFFLWVHYFDPHFSYLVHPTWTRYGLRPIDRYDGEIAQTDHHLGRLLDAVSELGLAPDSVVAFTSDHGEEFGEHGGKYHFGVEEEVLRIPLVVRAPGLEPGLSAKIAEQIDLLPTLLGLLEIDPPPGLPGSDLLALDPSGEGLRPVFIERRSPRPFIQRAVIWGDHKLLQVEIDPHHGLTDQEVSQRRRRSGVETGIFYYDLRVDPQESRNLYRDDEATAGELLALLREHHRSVEPAEASLTIDDTLRRDLEALGYLH